MNDEMSMMNFVGFDDPHMLGISVERADGVPMSTKWLKSSDGVYSLCTGSDTVTTMESGIYSVFQDSRNLLHVEADEPITDELYDIQDERVVEVIKEIETFWNQAAIFKKYKMKHKRGILLEGPGGTGKSSIINILLSKMKANGGLVFTVADYQQFVLTVEFLQTALRVVEPNRPVVVVIEDLDKYVEVTATESAMLSFLEGDDSIDHCVVITTTNRYSELNDLILRSSRIDRVINIPNPVEQIKKNYLIKKGLTEEQAIEWSKNTPDFSFADLKELFVSVILLNADFNKTKKKIKTQVDDIVQKTEKKSRKHTKMGFFGDK